MGPEASPNILEERKIPCPYRDSDPEFPARSLAVGLTVLSRFPMYYVYFDVVIAVREDKCI